MFKAEDVGNRPQEESEADGQQYDGDESVEDAQDSAVAIQREAEELAVFQPGEDGRTVVGRVAGKGLADELYDKGYLIVDGTDGKAHYVALPARTELEQYPTGAVVEIKGSTAVRAVDKTIAALATDGIYRVDHYLTIAKAKPHPDRDPYEVVEAHVRRLEALRRAWPPCRLDEPEVDIRLFEVSLSQQIKGLNDDLYDVGFALFDEVGNGIPY